MTRDRTASLSYERTGRSVAGAVDDKAILTVDDIRVTFGGVVALDGPSFKIQPGQICGLIGPNGAGKTTLFNCISRLYEPDSGAVTFGGVDLLASKVEDIAGLGIARTFQNVGLFTSMTVIENVMAGAHVGGLKDGFLRAVFGLSGRADRRVRAEALDILRELDLESVKDEFVTDLPFGTLKRIELARGLISNPSLLLLDEPANGLNHEEVMDLAQTIRTLCDSRGIAVLLVEHHMGMVMSISDHVVVLNFGRKIAEGAPAEVRADPAVVDAYLGGAA